MISMFVSFAVIPIVCTVVAILVVTFGRNAPIDNDFPMGLNLITGCATITGTVLALPEGSQQVGYSALMMCLSAGICNIWASFAAGGAWLNRQPFYWATAGSLGSWCAYIFIVSS